MGIRRRRNYVRLLGTPFVLLSILALIAHPVRTLGASATLLWTAPGDDGTSGRATRYDLRISQNPISGTDTLSWWNGATVVDLTGKVPSPAGSLDSALVAGLTSGARYYAMVRTADEVPNWSAFSNVASMVAVDGQAAVSGVVRDATTGAPLGDALVSASGGTRTTTAPDGTYSLSLPAGLSISLTASLFGYSSAVTSVVLAVGETRSQTFGLTVAPSGTLLGTARRASDQTPLGGATVTVDASPLLTMTAGQGTYSFVVPQGMVTARCERPGYEPSLSVGAITAGKQTVMDFSLQPARFYDDAETDKGWTLGDPSDGAWSGQWVRAVPVGTTTGSVTVQPYSGHSPVTSTKCFVTGNGTSSTDIGDADVDGGKTTLTSPALNLAGVSDARIVFWRWYSNNAGPNPGEDPFVTQISNNGGAWVTVDSLYQTRNFWERVEIHVSQYFATPGMVRVRFVAMDLNNGSIVEAAVDDFEYYSGYVLTATDMPATPEAPALVLGLPYPSPTSGNADISFELSRPAPVTADVFNVQGRRVCSLGRGVYAEGRHLLHWDGRLEDGGNAPSGVYWIRVSAALLQKKVKLILVR